ncbi:MAG: LEA type 2 family protein, partial [Salinirussus sp.]
MPGPLSIAKYLLLGLVVILLLIGLGFITGVLGAPTVEEVRNEFAAVNESTTTIDTNLTVDNPNPIGVSIGGLGVNYTILMNEVPMAYGDKHGLSIGTGNSTVPFRSYLANDRIPQWWYTHVSGGEVTDVVIDVALSHSLLGGQSVSLTQSEQVETDIIGQFNDSTTRPIDADAPGVSDPVLYLNRTAAWYGENLSRDQTPIEMAFTVYNPKPYPYTVTEVGYEIRMNGILVGEGSSDRGYAIPPGSTRTLDATTVLLNGRLDEWWVSHLERDQVTNLTIDTYVVIDPDASDVLGGTVPAFRIDSDAFDYQTRIETDIF